MLEIEQIKIIKFRIVQFQIKNDSKRSWWIKKSRWNYCKLENFNFEDCGFTLLLIEIVQNGITVIIKLKIVWFQI